MRYPAAEKLEIIRLVEQSSLPVRHTLAKLGIPAATFYRWYDRYSRGGPEALNDRSPRPDRAGNRIPDGMRDNIIELALEEPALSPRELAVRFTDTKSYFVSEASVYRLLNHAGTAGSRLQCRRHQENSQWKPASSFSPVQAVSREMQAHPN